MANELDTEKKSGEFNMTHQARAHYFHDWCPS